MESSLKTTAGVYHLVYCQPSPEDGERVCVAILAGKGNQMEVIYDDSFQKLRCIAPHLPPRLIKMYLDDLNDQLRSREFDKALVLRRFSPQLITSNERKLRWPLTSEMRHQLVRRFLKPVESIQILADSLPVAAAVNYEGYTDQQLYEFVQRLVSRKLEVKRNATPTDIVGFKIPGLKKVALAVHTKSETVLIDGVDLHAASPGKSVSRVNHVVHTFWQYSRIEDRDLMIQTKITRVGLVLNGVAAPGMAYRDAHDFALDQFAKGADLAVDSSSLTGTDRFRELLSA